MNLLQQRDKEGLGVERCPVPERATGVAECDRNELREIWKGKSLAGKERLKKEKRD